MAKYGNGSLPLSKKFPLIRKQDIVIHGGPYSKSPQQKDLFGICLREQVPSGVQHHIHLPIDDFSVPRDAMAVREAIIDTFVAGLLGKTVYAGCMGGWGRTGLFLAIMAKAAGWEQPIRYVRDTYTNRAVETAEQENYVLTFDVSGIEWEVTKRYWKARIKGLLGIR